MGQHKEGCLSHLQAQSLFKGIRGNGSTPPRVFRVRRVGPVAVPDYPSLIFDLQQQVVAIEEEGHVLGPSNPDRYEVDVETSDLHTANGEMASPHWPPTRSACHHVTLYAYAETRSEQEIPFTDNRRMGGGQGIRTNKNMWRKASQNRVCRNYVHAWFRQQHMANRLTLMVYWCTSTLLRNMWIIRDAQYMTLSRDVSTNKIIQSGNSTSDGLWAPRPFNYMLQCDYHACLAELPIF
jgi:hypothetical protein